jgi:hypothetical protein
MLISTDKTRQVIIGLDVKHIARPVPIDNLVVAQSNDSASEAADFTNISCIKYVINDFQEVSVYH